MADIAREHLDVEIERLERTRSMLRHLAGAIESGPREKGGETYKRDAMDALLHGADLARDRKVNMLHVAHIYDEMTKR